MISSFYITDLISNNLPKENIEKTFKISDIINFGKYKNYTRNTIFTVAVMEWILRGDFHTKQLSRLLYKYYCLFPETTPTRYGKGLNSWLENGAKAYRKDYECSSIAWCGVIAYIANDMNQLKTLIKRANKATNDTETSQKYCEMIAVAIYLNKKYGSKEKTLEYLNKHYGFTLCNDFEKYKSTFAFTTNAKNNVYASLNCFFFCPNYEETVSCALSFDSQFNIIASISGMLAESLYCTPINLSYFFFSRLPDEFISTILAFNEFASNPNKKIDYDFQI